jgi:hypothetical protein
LVFSNGNASSDFWSIDSPAGVQLAAGGVSGDLPEETWVRSDTGWLEEGDGHGRFVVLTGPDGGNWRRLLEELFISGGGVDDFSRDEGSGPAGVREPRRPKPPALDASEAIEDHELVHR